MIEPTDEMVEAFELAAWPKPDSETIHIEAGLAAVLALVERDHCLERKGHVYHPLMARPL